MRKKKIKIAFVYDAIYPFVKGGGEKRYYEIGKMLAKKGYEVTFYGMKYWRGADRIVREGMHYCGICKAKPLYTKSGRRSILQAIYFGISCLKLVGEDFDIIDCSGFPYFSLFTCKLVCLLKRKPLFSTWFEVWGKKYWRRYLGGLGGLGVLGGWIERLTVRLPDMIISISDLTTERLNLVLDRIKGIVTIPIGINFQTIDKIEPSKMKSEVIFAGRLLDFKNIDILIRAIRDIRGIRDFRGKNREVSCFIVGDGPERQRLIRLTKRLGLEKNIRFFGFLENQEEVFSLMKSSKIFVLPSSREGFGIVVLEANACELPVITVDRMENAGKELIKEGKNGFVCKLDSKEIASKIAFLLERSSPREKMGKEAVSLAKKYDWGKVIEKIEGVYLNRQVA